MAKFIAIMPVIVTSDTHHCSCLGQLGRHVTDRIVSISCRTAQGGQGKNIFCCCCNIANVSNPLSGVYTFNHAFHNVVDTDIINAKRQENLYVNYVSGQFGKSK
jgi:hypothetical protein